jgi:polyisoprenoid-binding protein YceI
VRQQSSSRHIAGKDKNMRSAAIVTLSPVLFLVFAARTLPAADVYQIDPTHTSVIFSASHWRFSYTYGMFREASGSYVIDKASPANSRFLFKIATNSIDTNNAKRDQHLRSADFLNVQQYPDITFESTKCTLLETPEEGKVFQLEGTLSMHGVSKTITVPLRMLGEGTGPYGDHITGFLCQIALKRSDFGMNNLLDKGQVGDAIGITISFEGKLTQPPPSTAPIGARPQ